MTNVAYIDSFIPKVNWHVFLNITVWRAKSLKWEAFNKGPICCITVYSWIILYSFDSSRLQGRDVPGSSSEIGLYPKDLQITGQCSKHFLSLFVTVGSKAAEPGCVSSLLANVAWALWPAFSGHAVSQEGSPEPQLIHSSENKRVYDERVGELLHNLSLCWKFVISLLKVPASTLFFIFWKMLV